MEEKLQVLVVDDSIATREYLKSCINTMDGFVTAGAASNGIEALEFMRTHTVDILITDLIMPGLDGVGLLEQMRELPMKRPIIVVISAMGSEEVVKAVMSYGANYYFVKPFDVEQLKHRLVELGLQLRSESLGITGYVQNSSRKKSVDEEIANIFISIGIPAHIKGYQYLREAVKMVMENQDVINSITKELYPGVGDRFGTSASKVERAIRHAIEVAWTRGKIENINKLFGYNVYTKHDRPTNGEFIALLADKMVMEHSA